MDKHDEFLIIGVVFIISLVIGVVMGSFWNVFFGNVNLSLLFI
jgi:hypothetical protein